VRKKRVTNSGVSNDGASQVTSEKDRAEDRSARNCVYDRAAQQKHAEREHKAERQTEFGERVHYGRRLKELHDAVHEQKCDHETTHDATGPERGL
jgi:hypothetical protein